MRTATEPALSLRTEKYHYATQGTSRHHLANPTMCGVSVKSTKQIPTTLSLMKEGEKIADVFPINHLYILVCDMVARWNSKPALPPLVERSSPAF